MGAFPLVSGPRIAPAFRPHPSPLPKGKGELKNPALDIARLTVVAPNPRIARDSLPIRIPAHGGATLPVSSTNSGVIYDALKDAGVSIISALPETWLVHLVGMADDDPEVTLVRLNKEEEGVGISAGAHLAGRKSAMLMQNHGLLTSINGIVSLAQLYRIPLLMLISYRGEMGERDPWQTEGGLVTERVLDALGIMYRKMSDPALAARDIRQAQTLAESSLRPVALLLTRELMWED